VAIGFFLILAGTLFLYMPNLIGKVVAFFSDFTMVRVPNTGNVFFPAPASPGTHSDVYTFVGEFSLIWGIFQIFILALNFAFYSSPRRKADTISHIIFWLGVSYLIGQLLNPQVTMVGWFMFWSVVIMLMGVSLIARAIVLAALFK